MRIDLCEDGSPELVFLEQASDNALALPDRGSIAAGHGIGAPAPGRAYGSRLSAALKVCDGSSSNMIL